MANSAIPFCGQKSQNRRNEAMMRKKTEIPPNNLEALRIARNLSMEKLGEAIGVDASTINKLEKRKTNISIERLRALADVLDVSTDEIVASGKPQSKTLAPNAEAIDRPALPVMGVVAGSLLSGAYQITTGPVEFIETPRVLEHVNGVYALYVAGTSMEPMFRHGTRVIASEYRPAKIGDAVVVQEQRDHDPAILASIGILEVNNEEKVAIRKLNPSGIVEISRRYVKAVHKVLDYDELLGA